VLALIVETMDTSLGTIEDVEETLGIPVLGVIPSIQKFTVGDKGETTAKIGSEPLVAHFAPRSPVSEAYRSLRTNLQFIRTDKKAKAYLITSSSLQEGKTYNVVNLSLSLAQAGEKVLLIDADLRRPTVHHIFGLERQPGLTDYIVGTGELESRPDNTVVLGTTLSCNALQTDNGWQSVTNNIIDLMLGEFGIDEILKTPGLDNLHIINAGQGLLNPAEILRSPRFKEFLRKVREHYDIMIIDTPPVLPVADAFEVAPEVDGVILVYEVGRIGRGILKRAKVQLENVNTNVLGVILNNVKPDVAPDFYRYRTDYYYSYDDRSEASAPRSPWREFLRQPLRTFQNTMGKMRLPSQDKWKRTAISLLLLAGILALTSVVWQNYPRVVPVLKSPLDKKELRAQNLEQLEPILPASPATKKRTGSDDSDVSPATQSQKTGSRKTPSEVEVLSQEEIKTDQPVASQTPVKEEIKPPDRTTSEQLSGQALAVAHTPISEDRSVADKNQPEEQESSPDSSIEHFIEKWRQAWEEGDFPTYIACYHPRFKTEKMDFQDWKNYKRGLFARSTKRNVQISDMQIEPNGSSSVATFKQKYRTAKHQDIGLKTLHLRRNQNNWTIFREDWQPLSGQG